ncbi:FadR/GntR family transcriptional regulator [Ancylobacter defluvii]|uniref:GntR family transcriptional regulator n=1 Tax=Ancylobacter defluvii TaxID=1282440 RepID=A0A9W6JWW2_9HYPH|nr:FCD domain-containing protein [Ancylobacter defluvii]GLK83789.1 GntR family transcriptional regulator [Ancylobacter defluvii]
MEFADVVVAAEIQSGRELAAYTQLQAFLAQSQLAPNQRLPAERELCDLLGVSRGELRKALAIAEADGQVWRHVGKGTFVGPRQSDGPMEIVNLAHLTSPAEVMRARILFEPMMAREAAINATSANISEMNLCLLRGSEATSWRRAEHWDNRLHRAIAESARNSLLLVMFDTLNTVRRAVAWGRLREDANGPQPGRREFKEHVDIVSAISNRNPESAEKFMRLHLDNVASKVFGLD